MIKNNLNLRWGSQTRPDKWLTPALLQKMHQAGFNYLMFGVESGSQRILDKMKKNYNIKEVKRVIRDTKNAGIDITVSLMLDSPGEALSDFIKTISFVLKTRKYVSVFSVNKSNITPRSDWNKNPSKYNIIIDYPLRWHSKYFLNNYIIAGFKKFTLDIILKVINRGIK